MALSIQTLKVDVTQEMSFVWLKCKQYDNLSRKYRVIICNRGKPLSMTGRETVSIRMWRDGDPKPYIDRFLDWEDGYPVVTFTSGMLPYEGKVSVDYHVYDPSDMSSISSRTSFIEVQKSLVDYAGLIAKEDYNVLEQLIQDAIRVPDLIATFNISQEEINSLIEKINADITAYQNSYNNLNTDATELITSLRSFLAECQASETTRISNENTRKSNEKIRVSNENTRIVAETKRQSDTYTAISACETATANTNAAIEEAYEQAMFAQQQGNRVEDVIRDLQIQLRTVDGGNLSDSHSSDDPIYDGGLL